MVSCLQDLEKAKEWLLYGPGRIQMALSVKEAQNILMEMKNNE